MSGGSIDKPVFPLNCPPSSASPADGEFFRFVKGALAIASVAQEDDWIPPHLKRNSRCTGKVESCECHAHSLFSDIDDMYNARAAIAGFRKKAIARVLLSPPDGLMLHTPRQKDSHHDFWPTEGNNYPAAEVIEERGS
jgi:hypothetical protein